MDDILEHPALDDQEESVRIAVRALGDMRNSVHSSPSASFQTTPALTIASRSSSPSIPEEDSPDFVSRVSHFPIVNTALRAYEHGKASSRVVKYGAEMMESSVKTISRPVIERLPVNQLDEFACRQLDRFDSYRRRPLSPDAPRERGRIYDESPQRSDRGWTSALRDISTARGRTGEESIDSRHDRDVSMVRGDDQERSFSAKMEMHSRTPTPRRDEVMPENQQVAQRSRWQAVLLEAGGIGAAVSEESMRRLKYCLQWLQYATAHIDQQISLLRDFIASLKNPSSPSSSGSLSPSSPLAEQHLQTLTSIRRDVVDTIRQVVDVVSKYAGGALPEPARTRVRSFILCLPQRWAHAASTTRESTANGAVEPKKETGRGRGRTTASAPYSYGPGEAGPSPRSRPASRATSPSSLRVHSHRQTNGASGALTSGAAAQAATKILTLATESLDMLRSVTAVFKESLDKADAWVERLRVVGMQRPNSSATPPTLPPVASLDVYRDPLPPIVTPGSSRAHSPASPFAQLQLPPLDPSLYPTPNPKNHTHHHNPGHLHLNHSYNPRHRALDEVSSKDLDALTLGSTSTSAASSRFATPRSVAVSLPPESDSGGGSRANVGAAGRDSIFRADISNERRHREENNGSRRSAGMEVDA